MQDTLPFRADQLELSPFGYNQLQKVFDMTPWLEWDGQRRGLTREAHYWYLRDWGYNVRENKYFDLVSRSRRTGALTSRVVDGKSVYEFECVYMGDMDDYFIGRQQDLVFVGRMNVDQVKKVVRQPMKFVDVRAGVAHGYEIIYYEDPYSTFAYARCVSGPQVNELTRAVFSRPAPGCQRKPWNLDQVRFDLMKCVGLFALGSYVEVEDDAAVRRKFYIK